MVLPKFYVCPNNSFHREAWINMKGNLFCPDCCKVVKIMKEEVPDDE